MTSRSVPGALRLYLVAGTQDAPGGLLDTIEAALKGGVTAVQLREKSGADREILATADRVRELCLDHDAAFFFNDRLDLGLAAQADGIHLGVDDLPIPAARRIAGERFIIGFSPDTDMGARSARLEGASYLGVGPVFGTSTKSDAGAAIGLSMLKRRIEISDLPVVGIGGIDAGNAGSVIRAGAAGIAVMSAILKASDPEASTRALREAVDAAL